MDQFKICTFWPVTIAAFVALVAAIHVSNPRRKSMGRGHRKGHEKYLGVWAARQSGRTWLAAKFEPPLGPNLTATKSAGFCGSNLVSISRLPVGKTGCANWTVLFSVIHEPRSSIHLVDGRLTTSEDSWSSISMQPLRHLSGIDSSVGLPVSRTSLITLLLMCNARPTFQYSDASGYRSNFGSYIGQWYITWPIGKPATVAFHPHDSHRPETDVYPPALPVRVDRCVQMMAGIITKSSNSSEFNVAFPSRATVGTYLLEFQRLGYAGSHGSRHIYNMNGGVVYDVDFLFLRRLQSNAELSEDHVTLPLPVSGEGKEVKLHVQKMEEQILARALDNLPWSSLSWSMHRGLRDILLAYSKPVMDKHRSALASVLCAALNKNVETIVSSGWERCFVEEYMGDMARSAVLAGRGNSGDLVRVVTSLAELCWEGTRDGMDETSFWGNGLESKPKLEELDGDAVIALTKCFLLEWSIDFDYQMYHQLPPELLLI